MRVRPVRSEFIGVVDGVALNGAISEATVELLERALDCYSVLVLHDVSMDDKAFVEFGRSFGELEDFGFVGGPSQPCIRLSNLGDDGQIRDADDPIRTSLAADALWHTDNTYRPNRARYSMLIARTIPNRGGETDFCDTRAAYDALPGETKEEIGNLIGMHSIIYSRELAGFAGWTEQQRAALYPVPQPIVFTNPRTERRSLYIASHICEIADMSTVEARALAQSLIEFATQPQFVYTHRWRPGDLVIWDDRATMHRRSAYDDLHEVRTLTTLRVVEPSPLLRR